MVKVVGKDQKALIKKHGIKTMKESSGKNTKQKKFREFRTAFIYCDCKEEMLIAYYDGEYDLLELSVYETSASFKSKKSWLQRLQYAYQVIVYDKPYADQIVLKRDQIDELKAFFNTI